MTHFGRSSLLETRLEECHSQWGNPTRTTLADCNFACSFVAFSAFSHCPFGLGIFMFIPSRALTSHIFTLISVSLDSLNGVCFLDVEVLTLEALKVLSLGFPILVEVSLPHPAYVCQRISRTLSNTVSRQHNITFAISRLGQHFHNTMS